MNDRQLVFKTVRENGDSLYATGVLKRNYEVGKTYLFTDPAFPGHCFEPIGECWGFTAFSANYEHRKEGGHGNRLLICLAEGETKQVDIAPLWDWRRSRTLTEVRRELYEYSEPFAATKVEVIGEVFPGPLKCQQPASHPVSIEVMEDEPQ